MLEGILEDLWRRLVLCGRVAIEGEWQKVSDRKFV